MSLNTSYGDLDPRLGVHAEMKLLEHADPILVLNKLGQHKPMPKNKGETIKFRRPVPLAPATAPLTEGVTPPASQFRYEDVSATLQEFGDWLELTNKITDLHEDNVGRDMSMIIGEQAAETIELVTYSKLIGGTNVAYANGSSRSAVNTPLNIKLQRRVIRSLRAQRAKPITTILAGSEDYNTTPIEAGYVAVCHTDLAADIRNLDGFVPVAEYGSRKPICPEELGSVEDVRYIASPLFNPWVDAGGIKGSHVSSAGSKADVYPILYLSQNAFGIIPLKGSSEAGGAIKPILRNVGSADSSDPMARSGSVAWRTWFTAKILNEAWIVRAEVAASDLV